VIRSFFAISLVLILSVMPAKPGSAQANWEAIIQISGPAAPVPIPEAPVVAKGHSWFPSDLPVTFDELIVATAAVATTFVAAAGSIALFVPTEAQIAVFAGLVLIAATPVDWLIIGGGAIAAYRYFGRDQSGAETEAFEPSWIDRWTYDPN
jgi:hypothetical protein